MTRGWSRFVVFILPFLAVSHARAHPEGTHRIRQVPAPEIHRPTPIPDRIILTWNGDPATTQAVTWRTDTTVTQGLAEITVAEEGPLFKSRTQSHTATTTPLVTDPYTAHYHTVVFRGLTPATKYVYRVGDGANWSEWFHFSTASATPEPFTFIYFGDAQNDILEHWSRVIREAYSDAPKARFFLHAGDLVDRANNDAEWGEWHQAGGFLNAMVPSIATPGNHEYQSRALSRHWRPMFEFPLNGPEGLEETVYYLDYQGVRVISLNSNERVDEQVPWLDQVLSKNPNRWTVVTFHHPVYSSARGRDNPRIRDAWKPLFDRHQVDLVLQGHDHTYARTNVTTNVPTGVNVASQEGTVYVVSVAGPKMYNLERTDLMRRVAEDTQLYQIIHVDHNHLRYEARTATGRLYDAFTLQKQEGRPNLIIEGQVEGPERRRPATRQGVGTEQARLLPWGGLAILSLMGFGVAWLRRR